jgi:hypothetical protein
MDRFTARRKLLRGSLSAPLVLTVASPAALARQSFDACLHRASSEKAQIGYDAGEVPPFLINAHDTWLRQQIPLYSGRLQKEVNEGDKDYYKKGDLFYKVNSETCPAVGYVADDFQGNKAPDRASYDGRALVFVNDRGDVVGWGPCPGTGQFPVSGSCWASFGGMQGL